MQKRIKDSFGLWDWSGVADGLYGAIVEQGYVANGQINYRECGKFFDVKLDGKLHGYNKGLVSACEKVGETMDKASGTSYASLVNQITQQLASSITGTVRGEVIKPIADSAASMVNSHFELSKDLSDKIINAIDHVKLKAEAATNQKLEEVTQQKREVLNTADVGKKTAKSSAGGKFHTVKKGETVWGIARKLGFKDETEFMASNPHLKKDENGFVLIKAGDQLSIPDGAIAQARVASETGVYGPNPISYKNLLNSANGYNYESEINNELTNLDLILDLIAHHRSIGESVASQMPGRTDGLADSYRHLLWSAELARLYPEGVARSILDFHEAGEVGPGTYLDSYNNEIGIKIGKYVYSTGGTWQDVRSLCREAMLKSFEGYSIKDFNKWVMHGDSNSFFTTSNDKIKIKNNLILDKVGVLNPESWKVHPVIEGKRNIKLDDMNWPKNNWERNFIYEKGNKAKKRQ